MVPECGHTKACNSTTIHSLMLWSYSMRCKAYFGKTNLEARNSVGTAINATMNSELRPSLCAGNHGSPILQRTLLFLWTTNTLINLHIAYQVDSGFLEGIIRGFRSGILTQNQYANLTQCETLEGAASPLNASFKLCLN